MEAYYNSPIGTIKIVSTSKGISNVVFTNEEVADSFAATPLLQKCVTQLEEYFKGSRKKFDLPLDWSTAQPFELLVWQELVQIPHGTTTTYSEIAKKLDRPVGASRAIGKAVGDNPIAIIVPCHRVVGKNGKLRGFAWGLDRKEYLLKQEHSDIYKGQLFLF